MWFLHLCCFFQWLVGETHMFALIWTKRWMSPLILNVLVGFCIKCWRTAHYTMRRWMQKYQRLHEEKCKVQPNYGREIEAMRTWMVDLEGTIARLKKNVPQACGRHDAKYSSQSRLQTQQCRWGCDGALLIYKVGGHINIDINHNKGENVGAIKCTHS